MAWQCPYNSHSSSCSAGIQAALYFLFGNNMIAFAFLLSCFFINSKTAGLFAYMLIFSTGILGSLLLDQLIDAGAWYTMFIEFVPSFALFRSVTCKVANFQQRLGSWVVVIMEGLSKHTLVSGHLDVRPAGCETRHHSRPTRGIVPKCACHRGYLELADYAIRGSYRDSYGMLVSNLHDADNGMTTTWVILAVEWVIFMLVAMYLEQVRWSLKEQDDCHNRGMLHYRFGVKLGSYRCWLRPQDVGGS